ncbi:hypothetical protein D3C78_1653040 [compost metagenome]
MPDKTLLINTENLLRGAIRALLMQADHPVTNLIEALFRDRVIHQGIIARVLVDPDPRTLHNPHYANADQLFERLSNSKT